MNKLIQKLRYKLRSRRSDYLHRRKQHKVRQHILHYYAQNPPADRELEMAVNYLSQHPLTTFYGTFQEKYRAGEITVFSDAQNGLPYVMTGNKKLYFKRSQNKRTIQILYANLLIEQDPASPHCYRDDRFRVEKGDVLADVGCAEGFFSLMHIEELERVYLFEQDREWIEALEATFAPWKEKITIIPRYVSDTNSSDEITLDDYFGQTGVKPCFYKIDVEGAEASVLRGMKKILLQQPLKIALCTYHHPEDFTLFSRFFQEHGFAYRANDGVMIFQNDLENLIPPYFRKCLIKAVNRHD